jgi:hypothetical protein
LPGHSKKWPGACPLEPGHLVHNLMLSMPLVGIALEEFSSSESGYVRIKLTVDFSLLLRL